MEDALACIEEKFPKFYELLEQLDPDWQVFSNSIEKITVIIPSDEIIDKCLVLINKKSVQVLETLCTFFIIGNFYTKNDWTNSRDNLTNLRSCKINIKHADKVITFDNDCEIKIIRNIKHNDYTMYSLESGMPPAGMKERPKKKATVDKAKHQNTQTNTRYEIYAEVYKSNDPVKTATSILSSFFEYLKNDQPELLKAILPFMDYSPLVSFMIIFEPSKSTYHFISNKIVDNWSNMRETPMNKYSFYEFLLSSNTTHVSIADIQEEREILLESLSAMNLINNLDEVYSDLIKNNKIGTTNNIYSDISFRYITAASKHYNIKLMQDELRALYDNNYESSEHDRLSMMYKYLNLLPYFNDKAILNSMTTDNAISNIKTFINTTYFLYILPTSPGQFGGTPGYYHNANPKSQCIDPVAVKMSKIPVAKNIITDMRARLQNGKKLPREFVDFAREIVRGTAEQSNSPNNSDDE